MIHMLVKLKKEIPENIPESLLPFPLDYLDSNQDKQNQNLLCCHYTIVQTLRFPQRTLQR